MGTKKVEFIPARKLSPEIRQKHGIKDNEFAEFKIINPDKGIEVRRVRSPIEEVAKILQRKKVQIKI